MACLEDGSRSQEQQEGLQQLARGAAKYVEAHDLDEDDPVSGIGVRYRNHHVDCDHGLHGVLLPLGEHDGLWLQQS